MSFGYVYLSSARHAKRAAHTPWCVCVMRPRTTKSEWKPNTETERCRGRDRTAGMQGNLMFSHIACWLHFWRYELRQWRIQFTCIVLNRKLISYLPRSFGHFGLWISNNTIEGECFFRLCWFRSVSVHAHKFINSSFIAAALPVYWFCFQLQINFELDLWLRWILTSRFTRLCGCVCCCRAARCVRWATQTKQRWISHGCNVIHSEFAKQFLPRYTESADAWLTVVCV